MILETLERWGRQEDRRARETGLAGKKRILHQERRFDRRKACARQGRPSTRPCNVSGLMPGVEWRSML